MNSSGLVEHIAEVEMSEGVAGIGFDGGAVVFLGESVFLTVVVKRTDVDVGGGMAGSRSNTFRYVAIASVCVCGSSSRAIPREKSSATSDSSDLAARA